MGLRLCLILLLVLAGCAVPNETGSKCTEDGCWEDTDYESPFSTEQQEQQAYACREDYTRAECCSNDPNDPKPYCNLPEPELNEWYMDWIY